MKGSRGMRVRECKVDSMRWFGFTINQGMLYGEHNGLLFVWTGKVRNQKRPDGSYVGKQVMLFTCPKKATWESDQRYSRDSWNWNWYSCGSGLAQKVLAKSYTREYKIIPPAKFKGRGGRALFTSDKNRRNEAAEKAYFYECHQ